MVDLDVVTRCFHELTEALPGVSLHYAVKANPQPEVVSLLVGLGARCDVASRGEIDLCLAAGADPAAISYGNPLKKASDIAYAYAAGVRSFVTDSETDLRAIAANAPNAGVQCRVFVDAPGSRTPFGAKFGCDEPDAVELLLLAERLRLRPAGVAFHVGSQHHDPAAWREGIAFAARVADKLHGAGIRLPILNIGGGFPVDYRQPAPPLMHYGEAIRTAVTEYFPSDPPELLAEPGRALVAEAGMIRSEVVAVSQRGGGHRPWVYLDIGRYSGLAETENEAIAYPLATARDGGPTRPVVIAGPTCDGDDVLYRDTDYRLPAALVPGDHVDILSAGAYTASYASVGFNGFPPLATRCIGATGRLGNSLDERQEVDT